jgi:hypothetical protein
VIAWETARASAFVAFGCYTLVVAWGVLLAGRAWRPAAPQLAFHRFLSSLGLIAVVLHVSAVLLDHYARVPLTGLVGVGVRPAVMLGAATLVPAEARRVHEQSLLEAAALLRIRGVGAGAPARDRLWHRLSLLSGDRNVRRVRIDRRRGGMVALARPARAVATGEVSHVKRPESDIDALAIVALSFPAPRPDRSLT